VFETIRAIRREDRDSQKSEISYKE